MGETEDFLIDRELELSILSNYFQFTVDGAFIMREPGGFQLIVQRMGQVVCKEEFNAPDEAKAAFLDSFGYKDVEIAKYIKPRWSQFSRPNELALNSHVRLVMEYALGAIHC